jgi:multicomponent Na+:H+ antiporter subunit E
VSHEDLKPPTEGGTRLRAFGLGVILFVFWLLLSGHYTPLLIVLGAASSAAVVLLARRMEVIDAEGLPLQLGWRLLIYIPWLMKAIVGSTLKVARIILTPGLPISPIIARYRTSQRTDLGRALYANSITLTPGTVTVGVHGDDLEIHSLSWLDVHKGEEGAMDRRVTWVEQGR